MNFAYEGEVIEIVKSFTYLGIVFTTGGSFTSTFETLAGQASKAVFKLNSYLLNFPSINIQTKLQLFDQLVLPILNYGSEIWGLNESMTLERVHLSFCKKLLGVKIQTQNNFVYGELGRTSLIVRRAVNVIRYWLKVTHLEDHKYVKCIYLHMCNCLISKPNMHTWAKSVCNLLQSLGLHYAWINQGVGDDKCFLSLVKSRLNDAFIQNWMSELSNSSRAVSYNLFCKFEFQPYLNDVTIDKFRFNLCRLRVSSHKLEIESVRWHKPESIPYQERKCQNCNVLEDEFHFLFECSLYNDIRKKYIKQYYWKRPNIPKFIELMQSDNQTINRNLANYVHKAFIQRNVYKYYFE